MDVVDDSWMNVDQSSTDQLVELLCEGFGTENLRERSRPPSKVNFANTLRI